MHKAVPSVLLPLFLFASPAFGEAAPRPKLPDSLVGNSSFERVVPGKPGKDVGQGTWTLGLDKRVPEGWSLNLGYPGTIQVVEDAAYQGKRAVRITAPAKRSAQVFHACPAIRPGAWYRISMRLYGGPGMLLVYEYGKAPKPKAHLLESTAAPKSAWRTITRFYTPSAEGFRSASIAIGVPPGGTAVIDDVVVEKLKSEPADSKARSLKLENKNVALTITPAGHLVSLREKKTGTERAAPVTPLPILTAVRDGIEIPLSRLEKRGSTWVAHFADPKVSAKLRVTTRDDYFLFEVKEAKPKDLDGLHLRFPVKPLRTRDAWMPGTYDATFGITLMGVTPNTESVLSHEAGLVAPEVRWHRRHGIRGGRSVLLATPFPAFLESIRRMEVAEGLPSPMLHSGAPGETGASEWARLSSAALRSYLFATYLAPTDLDALIETAKLAGFGMIMLHRKSWRASGGHEVIARKSFPRGMPDLVAACQKIHAAGLGVGLHLFGPTVSLNDAYVQPVPDKRLYALDLGPLEKAIDAKTTTIVLNTLPAPGRHAAPDLYPGDLLRIGDEIIRWRERIPGFPVRVLGCERGALGTVAAAHRKGAPVGALARTSGGLLVDPDSTLPEEMGKHLARVVNACQADLVYFDACRGAPPGRQPSRWYYMNKVLLACCAHFDHGVMIQTGLGPGRHLAWHLVPRSASADGHGDLKAYLDRRMPAIRQFRRTHVAADIGWYALDVHGKPDELEYVCAKALGSDASVSVQAYKALLDRHPRAREVFEMIGRWERRRLAGDVPTELRPALVEKGRDIRLLEDGEAWSLWDAVYEPARPIASVRAPGNGWTLQNDAPQPVQISLEIERRAIATTPAAHADPKAVPIADFTRLELYGDVEDEKLRGHILLGERGLDAAGFARRHVTAKLLASKDRPQGLPAVRFAIDSKSGGAGWAATGRKFSPALDLSEGAALGLWVKGDGHGESLALTLCDTEGTYARFRVALDYEGWRFQSFSLGAAPRGLDRTKIEYLIFGLEHIPPRAQVAVEIAALRAVPTLHTPRPMRGLTVRVGTQRVHLPATLAPNQCLTLDALGRAVLWPGGMRPGQPLEVAGAPLTLAPGKSEIRLELDDPKGYAGDLSVRVCRTWPLRPKKR